MNADRDLAERAGALLADFLAGRRAELAGVAGDLRPVAASVAAFTAGGKRLRPSFAYWGWRGAGRPDSDAVVGAAASLELLQACALIHDDVMDGSDTRRGRPAVHRQFAARHAERGWTGSPDRFGDAAAILLGDMCLVWAGRMLREHVAALPGADEGAGTAVFEEMCAEVMAGQYLDVLAQAQGSGDGLDPVAEALRVARFKSAKYTVEGPLHLGGALAGADPGLLSAYTGYGLPVGEAFQLRDDVLGVYGDPAETGKPAGDDLREGKRTVLVAIAADRADGRQAALLDKHLGDPDLDGAGVEALREVIAGTGALAEAERMIAARLAAAEDALAAAPGLDPAAADALRALAVAATERRI